MAYVVPEMEIIEFDEKVMTDITIASGEADEGGDSIPAI